MSGQGHIGPHAERLHVGYRLIENNNNDEFPRIRNREHGNFRKNNPCLFCSALSAYKKYIIN